MKSVLTVLAVALAAATAHAQTPPAQSPPAQEAYTTIVCLDVSGRSLPPVCRVPGSRLDEREFICQCFDGMRTVAPICPEGVRPPPESAALNRARRDAVRSGSLLGATFQGRPICVARGR